MDGRTQPKATGIEEVLTAPRSPWQNAYDGPSRPVGGEFPIVLPKSLNESTFAVMQSGPK